MPEASRESQELGVDVPSKSIDGGKVGTAYGVYDADGGTMKRTILPAVLALLVLAVAPVVQAQQTGREEQCLRTARLVGGLSGSTIGLITLYAGTFLDDIEGPYWKTLAIGVPTTVVGVWVGVRGTEWMTRKLLAGRDKVPGAAARGLLYGFLDGALIGSAGFLTALTLGHITGGIEFDEHPGLLEVMGMSILGGIAYGGTFGATVGVVYGPCISLYMEF